jgi:hypothetical protein
MNLKNLKSYVSKVLAFLALSAERFAELCLRAHIYIGEESGKEFNNSGTEGEKDYSNVSSITNFLPVQDLPTELYVAEYFTMPTALRTYGALLQSYRTELLMLICDHVGCEEQKAIFILKSMDFYIEELKAGRNSSFNGETAWLTDYTKMAKIVNVQNDINLSTRAMCTLNFLDTVDVLPDVLDNQRQLLNAIKRTGALPREASLLLLDIMAFVEIPMYLQRRVDRINVHLNSKLVVSGEFTVN